MSTQTLRRVSGAWFFALERCDTLLLVVACSEFCFLSYADLEDVSYDICNPCLQVYYELDEERKKVEAKDIAICRVEQLCPFPYDLIQRELKRYPSKLFTHLV